jgi:PhzF family phenazine biosynthesis protein
MRMAKEHNQSETAYFIPSKSKKHDYELRWFTPTIEIDLCGHATLASAYVIFNELGFKGDAIRFKTRWAGDLSVRRNGKWLELNFPVRMPKPARAPADLIRALNASEPPVEVLRTKREWYFVFSNEAVVQNMKPDFNVLAKRKDWQCVTAPGKKSDFVSRYFTANDMIMEDPVTGSTHCSLIPLWAERLKKKTMTARQLSARGGYLKVALDGDRVRISGQAVRYFKGALTL